MSAKLVFRGRRFHAKEALRAEAPGRSVSGMGGNGRRPEGARTAVGRRHWGSRDQMVSELMRTLAFTLSQMRVLSSLE